MVRYRNMVTEFLWPALHDIDMTEKWFQQDSATPYTARQSIMFIARKIWGPTSFAIWWLELATRVVWSNSEGFFPLGLRQSSYPRKQTTDSWRTKRRNSSYRIGELDPDMCQKLMGILWPELKLVSEAEADVCQMLYSVHTKTGEYIPATGSHNFLFKIIFFFL